MLDDLIHRIRSLDLGQTDAALAKHLATTNLTALEAIAQIRSTNVAVEIQRGVTLQLWVVTRLPVDLCHLGDRLTDTRLDVGLRLGLRAILEGVIRHAQVVSHTNSEAALLLEPALVFHLLLAHLRPWLPKQGPVAEPGHVLEALELGVPDFMLPLVHARVASSWRCFHRLLALGPADLDTNEDLIEIDGDRYTQLLRTSVARCLASANAMVGAGRASHGLTVARGSHVTMSIRLVLIGQHHDRIRPGWPVVLAPTLGPIAVGRDQFLEALLPAREVVEPDLGDQRDNVAVPDLGPRPGPAAPDIGELGITRIVIIEAAGLLATHGRRAEPGAALKRGRAVGLGRVGVAIDKRLVHIVGDLELG